MADFASPQTGAPCCLGQVEESVSFSGLEMCYWKHWSYHFQGLCSGCLFYCMHLAMFLSPPTAVDLLDKMLQLDVEKRLTATEALAHPYFEQFRDIEEETEAQQSYDDSLEHEKLSIEEWKSKKFFFEVMPLSSMGLSCLLLCFL